MKKHRRGTYVKLNNIIFAFRWRLKEAVSRILWKVFVIYTINREENSKTRPELDDVSGKVKGRLLRRTRKLFDFEYPNERESQEYFCFRCKGWKRCNIILVLFSPNEQMEGLLYYGRWLEFQEAAASFCVHIDTMFSFITMLKFYRLVCSDDEGISKFRTRWGIPRVENLHHFTDLILI